MYCTQKHSTMNNLEQLLQDKYPDSEVSEIQRKAFIEGYTQGLNRQ